MKERAAKKYKGALFYVLLCLCLGVWGYVFYQIAGGVGKEEDLFDVAPMVSAIDSTLLAAPQRSEPRGTYDGGFRDPFVRPSRLFTRAAPPPRQTPSRAVEPPPLVLSGIVDRTALLQGKDGSVFVARVGEQAGSVQVLTVESGRVVVRFEGRSYTLHLTP